MLIHSRGCFSSYPSHLSPWNRRRRIESISVGIKTGFFHVPKYCWRKEFFCAENILCRRSSCATAFFSGDMFMHIEVLGNLCPFVSRLLPMGWIFKVWTKRSLLLIIIYIRSKPSSDEFSCRFLIPKKANKETQNSRSCVTFRSVRRRALHVNVCSLCFD